jgi:ferredoxin-fold anticodon binding domain-containing protein
MGFQLNRALYDENGCLITVVGGNLFIIKHHAGTVSDITPDDIMLIESRLRAILMISHGLVFTKEESELSEWIKKDGHSI